MSAHSIREEVPEDHDAIAKVLVDAFGRQDEAQLVDELRASGALVVSLVVEASAKVIGHLALSRVTIVEERERSSALALAPMAVEPGWQGKGVGSALVREALALVRARGHRAVIVLGHPDYYPRFGFRPAIAYEIRSPWEVPPEAFMALGLREWALDEVSGLV